LLAHWLSFVMMTFWDLSNHRQSHTISPLRRSSRFSRCSPFVKEFAKEIHLELLVDFFIPLLYIFFVSLIPVDLLPYMFDQADESFTHLQIDVTQVFLVLEKTHSIKVFSFADSLALSVLWCNKFKFDFLQGLCSIKQHSIVAVSWAFCHLQGILTRHLIRLQCILVFLQMFIFHAFIEISDAQWLKERVVIQVLLLKGLWLVGVLVFLFQKTSIVIDCWLHRPKRFHMLPKERQNGADV